MFPTPKNTAIPTYTFGSIKASVSKGEYRYGMNTQEKDNEIYGEGNSYSAEYWQYDARLGRRWNVDPKSAKYPSLSPYLCFRNNPLYYTDPNGDESPEGFKKHEGRGGDLYLPNTSEIVYEVETVTVEVGYSKKGPVYETHQQNTKNIDKFTVGDQTYSANYNNNGDFKGYYTSSGVSYQNPDVQINANVVSWTYGTTPELNTVFDISLASGTINGLQMIQTVEVISNNIFNGKNNAFTWTENNTTFFGFVDGGLNSSAGEQVAGMPYYYSHNDINGSRNSLIPKSVDPSQRASNWNNSTQSGTLRAYDYTNAPTKISTVRFETLIIGTNFNNTGLDIILGRFQWGYNNSGSSPNGDAGGKSINLNPPIRSNTFNILNRDYPNYRIVR